jgi:hypothetical protein
MVNALAIELGIETTVGHCDTCGHESKLFRGFVYEGADTHGLYACYYTDSHPEQGVSMAVSLRGWGEGADPSLKECIVLEWTNSDTGPGCLIVDAQDTSWAKEKIFGRMLSREEALASGRATEAFAVSDVVWLYDRRLPEALKDSSRRMG